MGAMARKNIAVDVTPVFGNGTVCEIDPADGPSHAFVKGGVIKLHGNPAYSVMFDLPAGYQWDQNDPIWCSQAGCPTGSSNDSQVTVQSCTPTTLTINVDPQPPTNAVHVSLGFSNGVRFDPIIINQ